MVQTTHQYGEEQSVSQSDSSFALRVHRQPHEPAAIGRRCEGKPRPGQVPLSSLVPCGDGIVDLRHPALQVERTHGFRFQ